MMTDVQILDPLENPPAPAGRPVAQPALANGVWTRAKRIAGMIGSGLDWLFGLLSLVVGLAVLSIVPFLNFLSLGYLLHASGRVAATGKLRNGFVGIRKASVLGSFVLGAWIIFLPTRFISGLWQDAELVAPDSRRAEIWHTVLLVITTLAALQIIWASLRGGRLRHFLWPAPVRFFKWLSTPDKFATIRNAVVNYIAGLRLPYYFWLGARGFVGALIWLVAPVGILILAAQFAPDRGGAILSLLGGLMLMIVVLHLPFLQAHFALQKRFRALFAVRTIRRMFNRAPWAFWFSLFITLLFALPLYLLKIELPPREIAWLPSLLFVVFIFPARLLVGWAVARANRRETPRHWFFRWTSRFALIPIVFFYVFFVYLTQYLSWNGSLGMLEQHAFMVPAPLTSL